MNVELMWCSEVLTLKKFVIIDIISSFIIPQYFWKNPLVNPLVPGVFSGAIENTTLLTSSSNGILDNQSFISGDTSQGNHLGFEVVSLSL